MTGGLAGFESKYQELSERKLPPMLEEYLSYKRRYPDHFILFQVGDFYELFFDDARQVASLLNLTLTSRDKNDPDPIPMCGVPQGVVDGYLERLVEAGYSAAIVSQVQGERPAKGRVERQLERVVTPGVRIMGAPRTGLGQQQIAETIVAVGFGNGGDVSLAWSTALETSISIQEGLGIDEVVEQILRLDVGEIVVPSEGGGKRIDRRSSWVRELERHLPPQVIRFRGLPELRTADEGERLRGTAEFSLLSSAAKRAIRLLVQFLDEVTVHEKLPILSITREDATLCMTLDTMTRRNLEIFHTARDGAFNGSLLHYLDCTKTPGGQRLLRKWLARPLRDQEELLDRYAAVRFFLQSFHLRQQIRTLCERIPDIERICGRLNLNIVTPKELAALRDGLTAIVEIEKLLAAEMNFKAYPVLTKAHAGLIFGEHVLARLHATLSDNPPLKVSDGGVIRDGFDRSVDELRSISKETEKWLEAYEAQEREKTGISSLKVRSNNAAGLFIEISRSNIPRVPPTYIQRQTLTNGARFTTEELQHLEKRLHSASHDLLALEARLFSDLLPELRGYIGDLRRAHSALAVLDVFLSFAQRAEEDELSEPEFLSKNDQSEGACLEVIGGWHPVLKRHLLGKCVANNLSFQEDRRCLLLTGPNMGGKSTFLRQTGVLVLLAQVGSFVPAESMRYHLYDRIFARLGASDDIHEGDSTFMVEMKEAAVIARYACKHSLVLIDELGRGTATADGLSIAQSLLEYLVREIRCCCIFATHFHELIGLEGQFSNLSNISVQVQERDGQVIFTHEVVEAPASRSYGLEVARLAGLPSDILGRAEQLFQVHAKEESRRGIFAKESLARNVKAQPQVRLGAEDLQLPLDISVPTKPLHSKQGLQVRDMVAEEIKEVIQSMNPDDLTPREALEVFYKLSRKLHERTR